MAPARHNGPRAGRGGIHVRKHIQVFRKRINLQSGITQQNAQPTR